MGFVSLEVYSLYGLEMYLYFWGMRMSYQEERNIEKIYLCFV